MVNGKQYASNLESPDVDGEALINLVTRLMDGDEVSYINYIDTPPIRQANAEDCASYAAL